MSNRIQVPTELLKKHAKWFVLAMLAVALAIVTLTDRGQTGDADAGDAAVNVAKDSIARLLSYTPRNVEANLADEVRLVDGAFAKQYEGIMRDAVIPGALKSQVTAEATVVAAGVTSADADRVKMLVFVNVASSSADEKDAAVSGSRLAVTAEKHDGRWLVTAMDPI